MYIHSILEIETLGMQAVLALYILQPLSNDTAVACMQTSRCVIALLTLNCMWGVCISETAGDGSDLFCVV